MKKHLISGVFAIFMAGLLFTACQKDSLSQETPLAATSAENIINKGMCQHVTITTGGGVFFCHKVTCRDRTHELCSTCGVSRRPPQGCICPGTPTNGGSHNENGSGIPIGTIGLVPHPSITSDGNILIKKGETLYFGFQVWTGSIWVDNFLDGDMTIYRLTGDPGLVNVVKVESNIPAIEGRMMKITCSAVNYPTDAAGTIEVYSQSGWLYGKLMIMTQRTF